MLHPRAVTPFKTTEARLRSDDRRHDRGPSGVEIEARELARGARLTGNAARSAAACGGADDRVFPLRGLDTCRRRHDRSAAQQWRRRHRCGRGRTRLRDSASRHLTRGARRVNHGSSRFLRRNRRPRSNRSDRHECQRYRNFSDHQGRPTGRLTNETESPRQNRCHRRTGERRARHAGSAVPRRRRHVPAELQPWRSCGSCQGPRLHSRARTQGGPSDRYPAGPAGTQNPGRNDQGWER